MANKTKPKVYFPAIDEAFAVYQLRTGKTLEDIARCLHMTYNTFTAKRKGEGEFTFTEILHVCNLLGLTLEAAARDAVITYPDGTRSVLA